MTNTHFMVPKEIHFHMKIQVFHTFFSTLCHFYFLDLIFSSNVLFIFNLGVFHKWRLIPYAFTLSLKCIVLHKFLNETTGLVIQYQFQLMPAGKVNVKMSTFTPMNRLHLKTAIHPSFC